MTFGEKIKKRRKELGWTLTRVAKEAKVSVANISRYENEGYMPTFYTATRIADALNLSLDYLAGRADE